MRSLLAQRRLLPAYIILIVAAAVELFPFAYVYFTSLKESYSLFTYPPEIIPRHPTLVNYVNLLKDYPFIRWTLNTLITTGAVVLVNLITNTMAGYAFARKRFYGRDAIFGLVMAGLMIPLALTIIPNYMLLQRWGLLDTHWAIILPGLANPVGLFLVRQYMLGIPKELEEAARIDGAGEIQLFLRVIVPMARPVLAVLAILTAIQQWVSFLWPLISTTSSNMRTLTVGVATLQSQFSSNWGIIMAASGLSMLPLLVLFFVFQRQVLEGLTAGAVKG